jgi:hypothetical protein
MYHTPIENRGLSVNPRPFYAKLTMKKLVKNRGMHVRLLLSAAILAQWRRLVASKKALNLLYWAMHAVLYRRTAAAVKMASKVDPFFVAVLFAVALAAAGAIRSD